MQPSPISPLRVVHRLQTPVEKTKQEECIEFLEKYLAILRDGSIMDNHPELRVERIAMVVISGDPADPESSEWHRTVSCNMTVTETIGFLTIAVHDNASAD